MKNVTYINAGAGSGKTYTLTEKLTSLIRDNGIRPEQVIMTTFTIKAASEFKAKAKAKLHEAGLHNEAQRLDQALIGTIHSVCQRMITKYWYYLGLPPEMGVMEEKAKDIYIAQSLAQLPSAEEQERLDEFVRFFDIKKTYGNGAGLYYQLWRDHIKTIIDFSTNYQLSDYKRSQEESLRFIQQFLVPGDSLDAFDRVLGNNLKGMLAEARADIKDRADKKTIKQPDDYFIKLNKLEKEADNKNIGWYKLLIDMFKTKSRCPSYRDVYDNLCEQPIWTTKEIYEHQKEYIILLFNLAGRWRKEFVQFKKNNNLLDFNDMEQYMLQLLEHEDVAEEMGQSYRYLFVDEFQDCSPMQVKIFDRLSEHMEASFWVGDYKQAIYGFRGSDTELVKSVVDSIRRKEDAHQDGCHTDTLKTSYRSLPAIVTLNNAVFEKAFGGTLKKDNIHLNENRENSEGISSLRYFRESKEADVATHIARLAKTAGVKPSDIGVLGRTNTTLDVLAQRLAGYGVKVDRANTNVADTDVWQLVSALLRIASSSDDNLAKAQVALLTDDSFTTARLIDQKLLFDQKTDEQRTEFLGDEPLVCQALSLRPLLQQQSVATMVESLIIKLRLGDVATRVARGNATLAVSCLQAIVLAARVYEDFCVQMSLPATIGGLINHVETNKVLCGSDPDGVHIDTYHGSKGLEWPYVVMTALNNNVTDTQDTFKTDVLGVHYVYSSQPTEKMLIPDIFIRVAPQVYGKTNVPDTLLNKVTGSQLYQEILDKRVEEAKRLLYVGMTRPRDVLVMALEMTSAEKRAKEPTESKSERNTKKPSKLKETKPAEHCMWFSSVGVKMNAEVSSGEWDAFDSGHCFTDMSLTDEEAKLLKQNPNPIEPCQLDIQMPDYSSKQPQLRYISPSGAKGTGTIVGKHEFGTRITLNGTPAMDEVGNCIHQVFAGIELSVDIQEVIKQYGLTATLPKPADIRMAWQQLCDHLTATYGTGCTFHERPFRMERDGQTVVGSIDLVWQTEKGDYLIDFKTYPGDKALDPNDKHFVGHYAGQLSTYKEALEAAGEKVLKCFIYYPVGGLLVEVGLEQ